MAKAIVRKELEKISGVTATWFEWDFEDGGQTKHWLLRWISTQIQTRPSLDCLP